MEKTIMDKEAIIEALVSIDPVYRHMMNEASDLEKRFDKMVAELSNDQRNLVWDFVMKCEYISQRKMYLACQYMDFTYIADSEIVFSNDYSQRKAQAEEIARLLKKYSE